PVCLSALAAWVFFSALKPTDSRNELRSPSKPKIHRRLAASTPTPPPINKPKPEPLFWPGRAPRSRTAAGGSAATPESEIMALGSATLGGDARSTAEESSSSVCSPTVIWSEEGSADPTSDPGPPRRRDELGLSSSPFSSKSISTEEPVFLSRLISTEEPGFSSLPISREESPALGRL